MSKKNTNDDKQKLMVTLKDNRGHPITLSYQGEELSVFIKAVGELTKILEQPNYSQEDPKSLDSSSSHPSSNLEFDNLDNNSGNTISNFENLSKIDKMKLLIRSTYKYGWFSARDIYSLYQEYVGEISSSTISTYLSRLYKEDILNRRGSKRDLEYMLNSKQLKKIPEFKFTKENNVLHLRKLE